MKLEALSGLDKSKHEKYAKQELDYNMEIK
jgi:hypothetical protein